MASYKHHKQPNLDQLLYSHGDDSHNISSERSGYDREMEQSQNQFIYKMSADWNSSDNLDNQFLRMNGPPVEFSQNFSQNSMMYSHRAEEDSREYNRDHYLKLLEDKKKEEILFNEALDKQLNSCKQENDRKNLEISKLQELIKGLQSKIKKLECFIEQQQSQMGEKKEQIEMMKGRIEEYIGKLNAKDDLFKQYQSVSATIRSQLKQKQNENSRLTQQIASLNSQVDRLNQNLALYQEPDRHLLNFRGGYGHGAYQAPSVAKKNSIVEKELELIRKQKAALQIEIVSMRDKLEDRQNRFKKLEEEQRKKLSLKEKKLSEVEQRLAEMKDQQIKLKTQNQINLQKLNGNLNAKIKELALMNERILESERRIKNLQEQSRKKDEKTKQISNQVIDKNRQLIEKDKIIAEMTIKLQFDHQMIEDKDKEIDTLIQERKSLRLQIDSEKVDKTQKTERQVKSRRQIEKNRKDVENMKKEIQFLKKENQLLKKDKEGITKQKEQLISSARDSKKKLQQLSKKTRTRISELQSEIGEMRNRQTQFQLQRDSLDKAMRQLTQLRKKNESVPDLRNKIILLQSRLKNQHQFRDANQSMQSQLLQDRIQALQQRLEQRDKQNQSLRAQLSTGQCSQQEVEEMAMQLADREQALDEMQNQLRRKDDEINRLQEELRFKDSTLDFTHNILVKSEKAKIELEQEKKMLEEMLGRKEDGHDQHSQQQLTQFYEHQIEELERKLEVMRHYKEKEDQLRFEIKQLKQRIRQLNEALVSKERRITPETMSQQETVSFLTKTLKRVNRSSEMLKILARNQDFRDNFMRMSRQFNR